MSNIRTENLKLYFPIIAEKAAGFYIPDDERTVIVRMQDGNSIVYDDLEKTIRMLPKNSRDMSEDECRREFGIRLQTLLRHKHMSQTDLAIRSGVSSPLISQYITGKVSPSFYNVDRIAKALDCSIDELRYLD